MPTVLSPLQRKALFKAAVTLHEVTTMQAAEQMGVSYNHLMLVLAGERVGSRHLQERIAAFVEHPREELFEPLSGNAGHMR